MADSSSTSSDEESEYEVERILAQDSADGSIVYLVKWLGYPDNQCTWEPADSFFNPDTLAEWQRQLAVGDTLDEEQVAALQERMDAYAQGEEVDLSASDSDSGRRELIKRQHPSSFPEQRASKRPRLQEVSKTPPPVTYPKPNPTVAQAKSTLSVGQTMLSSAAIQPKSTPSLGQAMLVPAAAQPKPTSTVTEPKP